MIGPTAKQLSSASKELTTSLERQKSWLEYNHTSLRLALQPVRTKVVRTLGTANECQIQNQSTRRPATGTMHIVSLLQAKKTWLLLGDQPEAMFIIRNSKTGLFFLKKDQCASFCCLWQGSLR